MVYSRPFLRLVAIGSLYTHQESFSFSMSLISEAVDPEIPDEVPPALVTAFEAWWQSPAMISNAAELEVLKLNHIGTNGRYTQPGTVLYEYPDGIKNTSTFYPPAQIAYAVSLRTAFTRGRAHAGRFYIPLPSVQPNSLGTLADPDVGKIANPTETLLRVIDNVLPDWGLGIVSNLGAGAQHKVTHARYGRVLDTIRSRRANLPENYIEGEPL